MSQHLRVRMLCEGAVFVALAEILGFLKIGHLPNGGSVSLLMLPMIVFALRWGLGSGLLASPWGFWTSWWAAASPSAGSPFWATTSLP